jgi:type II secretory pathway component PulM
MATTHNHGHSNEHASSVAHDATSLSEGAGAVRWLLGAGGAAVLLAVGLFWADDTVMGGARAREVQHNAQLQELRAAQAGLSASSPDPRQIQPGTDTSPRARVSRPVSSSANNHGTAIDTGSALHGGDQAAAAPHDHH